MPACCAVYHLNTQYAVHLFNVAAALCQQVTHEHVEAIGVDWALHCNSDGTQGVLICLQSAMGI